MPRMILGDLLTFCGHVLNISIALFAEHGKSQTSQAEKVIDQV